MASRLHGATLQSLGMASGTPGGGGEGGGGSGGGAGGDEGGWQTLCLAVVWHVERRRARTGRDVNGEGKTS